MPWWVWLLLAASVPLGAFLLFVVGGTICWKTTAGRGWYW